MSNQHPRIAIFPGTFDPVTLGHVDVVDRGRKMFDHLIVAVGLNPDKHELFPIEERLAMIHSVVHRFGNVTVEAYEGLTVEFAKARGAIAILRGLRNMADLDFEFQIALTNRAVAGVETVFVMTGEQFGFTSSSLIKQIVAFGGNPAKFKAFLPPLVIQKMKQYKKERRGPFAHAPKDALKS